MTDAEVQQLVDSWREASVKQMEELRLRQWCVDKSIEYAKAGIPYQPHELLVFITKPFAEAIKSPDAQDS